MGRWSEAASSSPAAAGSRWFVGRRVVRPIVRGILGGQRFPLPGEVGIAPMNFQPAERILEDVPMREGSFRAHRRIPIAQTPLQTQDLRQPFDIASGQRQISEPGT